MPQRPVGRAARFDHRSRHDLSRSVVDDFWRDLAELTEGNQYCPGRGLSSCWAPKLQIMLVASPRNQLNRHEKVASLWRPFRLLGDGQHCGRIADDDSPASDHVGLTSTN